MILKNYLLTYHHHVINMKNSTGTLYIFYILFSSVMFERFQKLIATFAGGGLVSFAAPVGSVPAPKKRVRLNDTLKKRRRKNRKKNEGAPNSTKTLGS
jgi:hypothetical protein